MRKQLIAATAAALLLAACGNDNSSSSGVSLSSPDDVTRELSNFFTGLETAPGVVVEAVGTVRPSSATPSLTLSPTQRLFKGRKAVARAAAPRDATACSGGGTDTEVTDQTKSRTFTFFPTTTETVTYSTDTFAGCSATSGSGDTATTLDVTGAFEQGSGSDGDTESAQYYVLGSGANSLQVLATQGTQVATILGLGTIEAVSDSGSSGSSSGGSSSGASIGERFLTAVSATVKQGSTTSFTGEIDMGTTATPFSFQESDDGDSGGTATITGPYRYTSSVTGCGGGVVTVATPTTLIVGSGSATFTGGSLSFSSGGKTATLTFASDGTATLSGSATGTLTSAQVQAALESASTCLGGLNPSSSSQ